MTTSRTTALRVAAAGAVLAGLAVPLVAVAQQPAPVPSVDDPCGRTSWLAGTTELCQGVLLHRDYVMDDYGAANPLDPTGNTVLTGSLSPTAGDERYPDPTRAGTADLVDLSVRLVGDRLVAVFELNALYAGDETIAALAIDTDDDPATGSAAWDGITGIRPAGAEATVTGSAGDAAANTITLSMPVPAGTRWRLQALTAQADGTVMNVAFRGIDELTGLSLDGSSWWEGRQATALQAGDISAFGARVDVADLRGGVTREADHAAAGHHSRVFTSAHVLGADRGGTGEGYTYEGIPGRHGATGNLCEQEFAAMGRYQPYSVYVPEQLPARPGLQLFLHGCNANHSARSAVPASRPSSATSSAASSSRRSAAAGRLLLRHQRGRRPGGGGRRRRRAPVRPGPAVHVRVLDGRLRRDAARRALPRPLGGPDQLGRLHRRRDEQPRRPVPDRVPERRRRQRHRPARQPRAHPVGEPVRRCRLPRAVVVGTRPGGPPARGRRRPPLLLPPAAEHLTFVLLDEWGKEAGRSAGRTLVTDPARVRYRTDASLAYPEYGLAHDRAYWTSAIRAGGPGYSDVDLTTSACGGSLPVRTARNDAGPSPVPWVSDELETTGTTTLSGDRLTGSLVNVSSLVVDASATCLAGRDVAYAVTTDAPATLTLTDGRVLVLPAAGEHAGVLAAAAPPGAAPPCRRAGSRPRGRCPCRADAEGPAGHRRVRAAPRAGRRAPARRSGGAATAQLTAVPRRRCAHAPGP
jgi:hypothetical protein